MLIHYRPSFEIFDAFHFFIYINLNIFIEIYWTPQNAQIVLLNPPNQEIGLWNPPNPEYAGTLIVAAYLTGVQTFRVWIKSIKNLLSYWCLPMKFSSVSFRIEYASYFLSCCWNKFWLEIKKRPLLH